MLRRPMGLVCSCQLLTFPADLNVIEYVGQLAPGTAYLGAVFLRFVAMSVLRSDQI